MLDHYTFSIYEDFIVTRWRRRTKWEPTKGVVILFDRDVAQLTESKKKHDMDPGEWLARYIYKKQVSSAPP
jgi:hypothetical protein